MSTHIMETYFLKHLLKYNHVVIWSHNFEIYMFVFTFMWLLDSLGILLFVPFLESFREVLCTAFATISVSQQKER